MTIAVVGSERFSLGFDLIGIQDIFEADQETGPGTIEGLLYAKDFKLVIVQDETVKKMDRQTLYKVINSMQPIFVIVGPDGEKVLSEKVKRAVGLDMKGGEPR